MEQKRGKDGWFPFGEVFSEQVGPEQTLQESSPQATYHFTRLDQVDSWLRPAKRIPTRASWRG